jgi:hypothetical protein
MITTGQFAAATSAPRLSVDLRVWRSTNNSC